MQKKECNRYELLMEECLEIPELVFHGDQHIEEEPRPIEHCCKKENENLKFKTLIQKNIQGEPKIQRRKG